MPTLIDITGKRFGRLLVERKTIPDRWGVTQWICLCDCGKEVVVRGKHMKTGVTKSCGCLKQENLIPRPFPKGHIPWHKGLRGVSCGPQKGSKQTSDHIAKLVITRRGRKFSEEQNEKRSVMVTGEKNPFFGKKHSKETIEKISMANKGRKQPEQERIKRSIAARSSDKTTWNGGSSYFPYSPDFTKVFREKIRARDGYICQLCGKIGSLAVHHIDYNRMNTDQNNLISLCVSCHAKTNVKRSKWKGFFMERLQERECVNAH